MIACTLPDVRRLAGEHLVRHRAERVESAAARRSRGRPSPARATCTAACRARVRFASRAPPAFVTASAMPKSATIGSPACSRMFSGLRSRWITPRAMRVVERVGDAAADAHGLVDRQLLFAVEPCAQGLALDERHHIVQQPIRFTRVEQRQRLRMLEVRGDLDLAQEALDAEHGAESGSRTLSATSRSCLRSRARYTVAMPPRPISRSISYVPARIDCN